MEKAILILFGIVVLLGIEILAMKIEFRKTEKYHWFKISELDMNLSWLRGSCHILREHLPTTEEPTVEVDIEEIDEKKND